MSMDTFFTAQSLTNGGAANQIVATNGLVTGKGSITSGDIDTQNFLDFILTQLSGEGEGAQFGEDLQNNLNNGQASIVIKNNQVMVQDLSLDQAAFDGQQINIQELLASGDVIELKDLMGQELGQDDISKLAAMFGIEPKVIEHITQMAPELDLEMTLNGMQNDSTQIEGQNAINTLLSQVDQGDTTLVNDTDMSLEETLFLNKSALEDILNSIEIQDGMIVENEEISGELAALLNLNLTPQQISAIEQAQLNGEDITLEGMFSTIVSLVTPQKSNVGLDVSAPSASQQISERLSNINAASGNGSEQNLQLEQIAKYLQNFKEGNVEGGLKGGVETNANAAQNTQSQIGSPALTQNGSTQNTSFESMLQGWPFDSSGTLFSGADGSFSQELSASNPASANATQMGTLTSLIGQSQGATHAHPATKLVAVTMQKAASNGENTKLNIQLDPPELGRIEVQMNFSKEKGMKASIMVEKPETYMMLQRDSASLERALQEMGLEQDGGINFELAEQGFDFQQDNQRGGGHDHGGTGTSNSSTTQELEIIETAMTWQVDPETGHTRYDILV